MECLAVHGPLQTSTHSTWMGFFILIYVFFPKCLFVTWSFHQTTISYLVTILGLNHQQSIYPGRSSEEGEPTLAVSYQILTCILPAPLRTTVEAGCNRETAHRGT